MTLNRYKNQEELRARLKGLYVVTGEDFSRGRSTLQVVQDCIKGGARTLQLREKNWDGAKLIREGQKIRTLTREAGVILIVNDRIDVALAIEADGVHVGQRDIPLEKVRKLVGNDVFIGISISTLEEAIAAEEGGADYVGVSPVFSTGTKTDTEAPTGLEMLREIAAAISIPAIAIGGIKLDNAAAVIREGAAGVAVVSAVVGAEDVVQAAQNFIKVTGMALLNKEK